VILVKHTFQVQSATSQFKPLQGSLLGASGGLQTSISVPVEWGGVPESSGTGELLAAAAASCFLITTNIAAEQAGIKLVKLDVKVEGDMVIDARGVRITELRLFPAMTVEGGEAECGKMRQLAQSCSSNCVISKAIAGNVDYIVHEPVVEST
jgi:peroxiredoxin-like protein